MSIDNDKSLEIKRIIIDTAKKQRFKEKDNINQILFIAKNKKDMSWEECVQKANDFFNTNVTLWQVKNVYRNVLMRPYYIPFNYGKRLATAYVAALKKENDGNQVEKYYKETRNSVTIKIALFHIYSNMQTLQGNDVINALMKLDNTFARECFESLLECIEASKEEDISDYEMEIIRLQNDLNRANNLISRLQEEYDYQIKEIRNEEQQRLIQELNSDTYDSILDSSASINAGLRILRKTPNAIPQELLGVSALVRNILQFAEDCGMSPIAQIGERFTITGQDSEYYEYLGTPFKSQTEEKEVEVMSSGWEIKEKNLVVSPTVVKEYLGNIDENNQPDVEPTNNMCYDKEQQDDLDKTLEQVKVIDEKSKDEIVLKKSAEAVSENYIVSTIANGPEGDMKPDESLGEESMREKAGIGGSAIETSLQESIDPTDTNRANEECDAKDYEQESKECESTQVLLNDNDFTEEQDLCSHANDSEEKIVYVSINVEESRSETKDEHRKIDPEREKEKQRRKAAYDKKMANRANSGTSSKKTKSKKQ